MQGREQSARHDDREAGHATVAEGGCDTYCEENRHAVVN